MINEIHNENCLDTMSRMPDKSVDLILTDPPYGIGESLGRNKSRSVIAQSKDYGHLDWDKERVSRKCFNEMFRVSKNQIIFGGNYYIDFLKPTSCMIVWDKNNGQNDFADCELAWTSFDTAVRKIKWTWHGMIQEDMGNKEKRFHPTQKPVGMLVKILKMYSKAGEFIYDPFMGSGSILVAGEKMGCKVSGSEISKEYCDIAEERRMIERSQMKLFSEQDHDSVFGAVANKVIGDS